MKRNIFAKTIYKSKKINLKALQALDKNNRIFLKHIFSYFYFDQRVSLRLPVKGSISIEAAVAIPIFMFCFLEIMSILNYLSVYSTVLVSLKNIGDEVSIYGCAYDDLLDQREELAIGEEIVSSFIFSETYLDTKLRNQLREYKNKEIIEGGINGINLFGSHVNSSKDTLLLYANYMVKPIVGMTGLGLDMNTGYYVRLWTGYNSENNTQAEYVYITDTASVYHLYQDCTHLKLSIKVLDSEKLLTERNAYGVIYSACMLCIDEGEKPKQCYITSQGDRYHYSISCSGLKRTVYYVEKSQIEELPLCSRCKKREEESR